ncbi:MAG: indolepyruvate ferredoxin oxidoreductase [Rhodospirillaceae bacterium]|nr:indolepyruvate ferredoxin oxidoreductase [Rhodospirillaceae bacterium]
MDGGTAVARVLTVGERSFKKEIEKLLLSDGETFHGEGILAITKALLQSGISYVGGYPGAPMSHLIDVLADASEEILKPMGIHYEQSASEAGAAALLSASIGYPIRGAVTWKSVVGTNVASDALSNLASSGVVGGSLIILGDDYGEGSSIMQERTYTFAMKSAIPLLDPRYNLGRMVELAQQSFDLSEACSMPIFYNMRIRACHLTGDFTAKDNKIGKFNANNPVPDQIYDVDKIVLPPATYRHEKAKFEERLPAAQQFARDHRINELFQGKGGSFGIITQGGTYTVLLRALRRLGAADAYGNTDIPILCLNLVYPLIPDEIQDFMAEKDHILVVEEGNPNYIESQIAEIAQRCQMECAIHGKDVLPMAGEYVTDVVREGVAKFLTLVSDEGENSTAGIAEAAIKNEYSVAQSHIRGPMPARPPSFCTGCPERPIMAAMKLLMKERGKFHVSMDIGCNLFGSLPPFNVGNTVLGYGLSLASSGAVGPSLGQSNVAIMGDGGFWHNGFTSGVINARWNEYDSVLVILDNGYAAATGQHKLPSTGATPIGKASLVTIESALRGVGVEWIKYVDSYSLEESKRVIGEALDAREYGLRVVISNNECMLARQRKERPAKAKALKAGQTVVQEKFGVDEEVCTGDHSCMRLNGCPSLTLKESSDPFKETPIAHVDQGCFACGHCGEVAHAAQLCPSFYKAEAIRNPRPMRKFFSAINRGLLSAMGA